MLIDIGNIYFVWIFFFLVIFGVLGGKNLGVKFR